MPRRNHRARRPRRLVAPPEPVIRLSTDALARSLVARNLASPLILDRRRPSGVIGPTYDLETQERNYP